MQRNHTENWKDVLSVDFSAESEKRDEMKQALLQQVFQQDAVKRGIQKEDSTMQKTNTRRFKRSFVIAACLVLALSITAFAVVNYLDLGKYAQYVHDDSSGSDIAAQMEEPLPEELRGLLYDSDGKAIEKAGETLDGIYNANGEAVTVTYDDFGNPVILTQKEAAERRAEVSTLFDNLEEAQAYLVFNARSFDYIPADYVLEGYRIFNDENGQPQQDTKYLQMYFYKNGNVDDYIYVQARFMDEETSFTSDSDRRVEKTTINGYETILGESGVDILIDDVLYMIYGKNLPQSEVIKMAESLTK